MLLEYNNKQTEVELSTKTEGCLLVGWKWKDYKREKYGFLGYAIVYLFEEKSAPR